MQICCCNFHMLQMQVVLKLAKFKPVLMKCLGVLFFQNEIYMEKHSQESVVVEQLRLSEDFDG